MTVYRGDASSEFKVENIFSRYGFKAFMSAVS